MKRIVMAVFALLLLSAAIPVSVSAGSAWTALNPPRLGGVGVIKAIAAAPDGNTVFAMVTNPVGAWPSHSYIVRTIDGGENWTEWGKFNQNSPSSANFLLAASPTADKALFVGVANPAGSGLSSQIYYAAEGEDLRFLGGVSFPTDEVLKTLAVSPVSGGSYTLAAGTVNPVANRAGSLYLYRGGTFRRIKFDDIFSPRNLDIYAMSFLEPSTLVIIASPDEANDQGMYVYYVRLTNNEIIMLPTTLPLKLGLGVNQPGDELSAKFGIAFPTNWLKDDGHIVSYSPGYGSGTILRRAGNGYATVYTSNAAVSGAAMMGSSTAGVVFVGGANGVIRSIDGGRTWSKVDNNGVGGETLVAIGGGNVYAAKIGASGGVYKSSAGAVWRDTALYTEDYYSVLDWVHYRGSIATVMLDRSGNAAIFLTSDNGKSWKRVKHLAVTDRLSLTRLYAAADSIYAVVGRPNYTVQGQILRSDQDGVNWTAVTDPSDVSAVTNLAVAGAYLVAQIANNGIMLSADAGGRWTGANSFGPPEQFSVLLASPSFLNDGTLIGLGTARHTAYISRDKGNSWFRLGEDSIPGTEGGLAFHPDYATNRMIYATSSAGIFTIKDDGANTAVWKKMADAASSGIPAMRGNAFYVPSGGDFLNVSDDISAAPLAIRRLALTTPAKSWGTRRVTIDGLKVYTLGSESKFLAVMTDLPPTPTPTATPIPGVTPGATPTAGPASDYPIVEQLASLSGKYWKVYGYDPQNGWSVFDPRVIPLSANSLRELKPGKGYWIYTIIAWRLQYQGKEWNLGLGWNLIGW